jgi:hypothetical protein
VKIQKNLVFKADGKTWKTVELNKRSWKCVNTNDPLEVVIFSSIKISSSVKDSTDDTSQKSIENIAKEIEIGMGFFDEFGNILSIAEKLPDGFWVCQLNKKDKSEKEDITIYYSRYIAISIHHFGKAIFFNDAEENEDIKRAKQSNSSRKYLATEKGKEALRKYRMSKKGRDATNKAIKKYFATEKGKEAKKRYMKKYKARPEVQERQRERDRARDRTEYMRNYMRERRKKKSTEKSAQT